MIQTPDSIIRQASRYIRSGYVPLEQKDIAAWLETAFTLLQRTDVQVFNTQKLFEPDLSCEAGALCPLRNLTNVYDQSINDEGLPVPTVPTLDEVLDDGILTTQAAHILSKVINTPFSQSQWSCLSAGEKQYYTKIYKHASLMLKRYLWSSIELNRIHNYHRAFNTMFTALPTTSKDSTKGTAKMSFNAKDIPRKNPTVAAYLDALYARFSEHHLPAHTNILSVYSDGTFRVAGKSKRPRFVNPWSGHETNVFDTQWHLSHAPPEIREDLKTRMEAAQTRRTSRTSC